MLDPERPCHSHAVWAHVRALTLLPFLPLYDTCVYCCPSHLENLHNTLPWSQSSTNTHYCTAFLGIRCDCRTLWCSAATVEDFFLRNHFMEQIAVLGTLVYKGQAFCQAFYVSYSMRKYIISYLYFLNFYCIFHYYSVPLYPLPSSQSPHCCPCPWVLYPFAQPLHPLIYSPLSCPLALCVWVCLYFAC